MKVSKITAPRPTTVQIDVLGEAVTVTYDRSRVTNAWWDQRPDVRSKLADLLITWDITADDGASYAPDPSLSVEARAARWLELFEPLPSDVLLDIHNQVLDDLIGGNARASDSSAS